MKDTPRESIFTHIQSILDRYGLPSVFGLLNSPPTKEAWKCTLNHKINDMVQKLWRSDTESKSSTKYLKTNVLNNDRTLDLLFANSPSPVNRVKGMPPIGKADHDIIYVEYDIKAKRIQQAPRKIYLYKRADMEGLRDHLARFRDSSLSSDHSHMSVNDMWVSFKSEVLVAIERFIPTKMTKTKYSLPWIDHSIKRLIRKREKLYFRARKSSSPDIKNHCKRFREHVQKAIRDAYWKHISNI